jgi:hypothetical protein
MIKKRKTVAVLVVVLLGLLYAKMASAQNVRFHIAEGNFKGVSQAESQARIIDGLRELERLTEKLTFEQVDNSRRAKLRISFGNPNPKGDILCAGSVSVSRNRKDVVISTESTSFSGAFNRNIETLSMHLGLNSARFRFSSYTKVIRQFSIPAYPSQTQMAAIRKKYKVPSNEVKFLPLDLIWMSEKHQYYVALHNAFWAERRQLLLIRDGATNSEEMALAQAAVMENYLALVANKVPMSAAAAQWHYVNNNWIGFPNFINNTGVDPDHPNNGNGDRGDH